MMMVEGQDTLVNTPVILVAQPCDKLPTKKKARQRETERDRERK
jgi:hypothetical protein